MPRWFNTVGPFKTELHYMLPVLRRLPGVRQIIHGQGRFVLHAPRQVGKTTALIPLATELTAESRHAAVIVSMKGGAPNSRS